MGKLERTRLRWGGLVATVAAVAVYLSAARDSAWQIGAFFVPLVLATGLLVARTKRTTVGARGPLPLLLTAQVFYVLTSLIWYLVPVASGEALVFPSIVDALFLTVYAAYAAFLMVLLRRRARDREVESRIALTDALILAVSMSAVLWVMVIDPNLRFGTSTLSMAVAVLYPVSTLLLFVLGARLAVGSDLRRSGAGLLLLAWVGAEIIGDTIYAVQSVDASFRHGTVLSVAWMVSNAALAGLAAHPGAVELMAGAQEPGGADGPRSLVGSRVGRAVRLMVLLVAAVSTVLISYAQDHREVFLLGASVLTVGLVVYRTSLLAGDLDQERQLAAQLDEAVRRLRDQHALLEGQSVQMERLAFHDSVTGLGNRALLRQRAETVVGSMADTTLLLLDLDGFKEVNDTLGHAAGDVLLLEVGDRLGRCVRANDTVVRLGGDEFALLLPDTGQVAAARTAQRVLVELREPFYVGGVAVQVRGSIGVASGATAKDLDEMLRNADLAMYEAKGAGRDQACEFHPVMHLHATRRLGLETEVRAALARGDFIVYYQPIVDAVSREVRSVEALVRWEHPERGVLPPSEFLPAAERTGLIVDLGRLVLRTACAQVAVWRQDWPDMVVAVNVSQQELLFPGFAEYVETVLSQTGLPPAALHLEVTETVLAAEEFVARILEPLAALGVLFAIDDFGTGHSSLSRLRGLNVTQLKIDRSFIAEIGEGDDQSAPLLASIIALAHSVGHTVVAEGVETDEQAAFLTAQGCDELQGYLVSRPVAASQMISVLMATSTSAAEGHFAPHSAFPHLIARVLDPAESLDAVLPTLLQELTELAGLECCFMTEVGAGEQVTRYAAYGRPDAGPDSDAARAGDQSRPDGHGAVRIAPGLALRWSKTLCRRMLEDGRRWTSEVPDRYGDFAAATDLGIQTYVTVPVRSDGGDLRGTLCAASSKRRHVDKKHVELMELFAQALAGRLAIPIHPDPPILAKAAVPGW